MTTQKIFIFLFALLIFSNTRANDTIVKSTPSKLRFGLSGFSLMRYDENSYNIGASVQYKKTVLSLGYAIVSHYYSTNITRPFGGYLNAYQKFSSKKFSVTGSFLAHYLTFNSNPNSFALSGTSSSQINFSASIINFAIGPGVHWEFIKNLSLQSELLFICYFEQKIALVSISAGEAPLYFNFRYTGGIFQKNRYYIREDLVYLKLGLHYQFPQWSK